jgi:hypothetical protein
MNISYSLARIHCLKKNVIPSQNLPVSSCKKLFGSNDARNKEAGSGFSSS